MPHITWDIWCFAQMRSIKNIFSIWFLIGCNSWLRALFPSPIDCLLVFIQMKFWKSISLVGKGGSKTFLEVPKMVHFDENPIFRSDPISRLRLISIWILDMVKSMIIFSDHEVNFLNIFIEYFKLMICHHFRLISTTGSDCEDWTVAYLF